MEAEFTPAQSDLILEVCEKVAPDPATKTDVQLASSRIETQLGELTYKFNYAFAALLLVDLITVVSSSPPNSGAGRLLNFLISKLPFALV